ncbi:MAG: 3-hydroxyacyl-ACP dehydratase FabZ [Candidatus Omnitrophica bacterium]|nr:3-hydroxyacyl-ACP dehydratase FabZ [Candidatus Omnitrophota bacterium]
MTMLNIEEIFKILPQRFPFVMIDRILELEPKKKVVAIKNISFNEEFFDGHFPGKPIMPGVLIIEAMAQASIILFYESKDAVQDKNMVYYLGSVRVRFFHPVTPGDQLKLVIEPLKILSSAAIVRAQAFVADVEVAGGELSFVAKEDAK